MNTHHLSGQNVFARLTQLAAFIVLLLCAAVGSSPAPAAAAPPNTPLALSSSITQVSAGWEHTCALRSDGAIACWGFNDYGQASPPNPNSGFIQLSAGSYHTCAVREDSSLACWGRNDFGQVSPLPSPTTGFTQVGAGSMHTCAVKSDSSIACWGLNDYGQATPPSTNTGFTQVSAGMNHTCARKSDGSIACWGSIFSVPNPNTGYTQVSTAGQTTCALRIDRTIACWGMNNTGQATPPILNNNFTQVSAGAYHSCARKIDGSIACWGSNQFGQTTPPNPNSSFIRVAVGGSHTCALKNDGAVTCWGLNNYDQAPTISLSPNLPASIPYGDSYTQALTATGEPGGEPYTFNVTAGTLPPGLALSSTGTLYGTPSQAGSFSFTVRALDAIGYMGTRAYTLTIPRAPLTVKADDASRAYGYADPTFSASYLGLKNNDPISATFTTPALPTSLPGTYAIVPAPTGDPAILANYILTTADGTLTVTKAPLTVKPDDLTRPYGSDNPPLTYALVGLMNGEGPGVVSGEPPTLETDAVPLSLPGDYPILIMGNLAADNYNIIYAPGTLHIEGAQLFLPAVLR